MPCDKPNWILLKECGEKLTRAGNSSFTRKQLIDCVHEKHPEKGGDSLNPMIQGMTVNLKGGAPGGSGKNVFYSVGRGLFELYNPKKHGSISYTELEARSEKEAPEPRFRERRQAITYVETKAEGVTIRNITGYPFRYVCAIQPDRDGTGKILQFMPQSQYKNVRGLPLHEHGSGPFCRFRIPGHLSNAGVYVLLASRFMKYVGECISLSSRFNMGYGQISPRNCYKGGQVTNCKINNLVLEAAQRDERVESWFFETKNRKKIESELKDAFHPSWNA